MSEEIKTTDNAEMQADLDEVMRKYDRESNTRIWKGKPAVLIKILAAPIKLYPHPRLFDLPDQEGLSEGQSYALV